MTESLVIRLGDNDSDPAHWMAVDSSGARRSPPVTGPLEEARTDIGTRDVIVLVPSTEVLTTSVDLPLRGGAKLQQALPYALEEYLADDVENLHFAAGARRRSGKIPAAVVNRSKMDEWTERLSDAGIKPETMVADIHGLARIPGTISMLVADGRVIINDGADIELVIQDVSPGDALAAIGALDDTEEADDESDSPALPRHVLVYCEAGDEERYKHDWIALRHELDSLDVKVLPDGVLPRLAVTVATGAGIDLLQGDYGAKANYAGLFRPWKYAAMLLLGLGVAILATRGANYYLLKSEMASLQEQFMTEVQKIRPGTNQVNDPVRFVGSLRNQIGTPDAPPIFLQSMESLSRATSQHSAVRIDAVSYRSGTVNVRLSAPDVTTVDNIQRIVGESGQFSATIQSAEQQSESVNSQILIESTGR